VTEHLWIAIICGISAGVGYAGMAILEVFVKLLYRGWRIRGTRENWLQVNTDLARSINPLTAANLEIENLNRRLEQYAEEEDNDVWRARFQLACEKLSKHTGKSFQQEWARIILEQGKVEKGDSDG
jgi:hypothetical protein